MAKFPRELITVTPLSITLSAVCFIFFVVVAFYLGMQYQQVQNLKQTQLTITQSVKPIQQLIASPTPTTEDISDWKTYTNSIDKYSFKYPADWKTSTETRQGYATPMVRLAPPVAPCPTNVNQFTCETSETIFISTEENLKNLSIQGFVDSDDTFKMKFTPVLIDGIEAKRTYDRPGRYENEDVYIAKDKKIYHITRIIASFSDKKISQEVFDKLLTTFKFTD